MNSNLQRIQQAARHHPRSAIRLFGRFQANAREAGQHELELDALYFRFFTKERLGEAQEMLDELHVGLQQAENLRLKIQTGQILVALGRIYYTQGIYREAVRYWIRCVDLCKISADIRSLVEARIGLGQVYDAMQDWETGAHFHVEAGHLLRKIDDPYLNSKQAINLAVNQLYLGQLDSAEKLFIRGRDEAVRAGSDEYVAESYWYLGTLELRRGSHAIAETHIKKALHLAILCDYQWLQAAARNTLAEILKICGNREQLLGTYLSALEHARKVDSRAQKSHCYDALSRLYEESGDLTLALSYARQYQTMVAELNESYNSDKFRELRQYDLSRKPPSEVLLDLSSDSRLEELELTESLYLISATSLDILRVEHACIWLKDEHSLQIVCQALSGMTEVGFALGDVLDEEKLPKYHQNLSRNHGPILSPDLRLHHASSEISTLFSYPEVHSLLEVPLRMNGVPSGVVIFAQSHQQRNWSREDVLFASHLGNLVLQVLAHNEHVQRERELEYRVEQRTHALQEQSLKLEHTHRDLQYKDQALSEHLAQSQSILDNLADGVITIDSIGTIRSFNAAASKIFGYSLEEVMSRNIKLLMPEPHQSAHTGYMQSYVETGIAKVMGRDREVEGLHKNGTIIPLDLAISQSIDHNEIIFIGIVRDITERRRLDRLKSEFVSTVSHELRTPLTSIHGALKLLEGGIAGNLAPSAHKLINLAQKNSQRLILLINDLLDMEKLAAGKMVMDICKLDLVEIIQHAIETNANYAQTLKVRYVLLQHPWRCMVLADATRVAQILANLMSNAAKFSAGAEQVELRLLVSDQYARVEVEDHGEGIPENFQSEIFSAFAQANNGNTRKQGGTGLGLKISKSLILAMHGEIGFHTQQGKGTVFWFTLPLVK